MSTRRWRRFRRWWRTTRHAFWVGYGSVFDPDGQTTYNRMVRLFEEEAKRP